jgi:serine/threonine protein kinase/Tol biopolymer transport system component
MLAEEWLGRYKILRKIAEGGMGLVYLAEDTKLNRQIAIKVLPSEVSDDSQRLHRFIHEAKSASALNHPNIITIYEINEENDTPFIAMEFVSGETLAKAIRNRSLDMRQKIDIAIQIASALSAAHKANVIHRDIKPDNIIIRPDGIAKILDFGLAKLTERRSETEAMTVAEHKTNPGMIMGTVGYLSPEQARGKVADERSDIFSFGAMLYQMVSGKQAFSGENNLDIIASIIHKDPVSLEELNENAPPRLVTVVERALKKDPADRFQTVDEMLVELRAARNEFAAETGTRSFRSADHLLDDGTDIPPSKTISNAVTEAFTLPNRSDAGTNTFSEILISEAREHPLRAFGALGALLAVCFIGIFAFDHFVLAKRAANDFQNMKFAKATTSGNIASAQIAVSPNGKMLAYVARDSGRESLWVKQSETSAAIRIVEPAEVTYSGLTFSPDSNFVTYLVRSPNGRSSLEQVDALGSVPRKIAGDITGRAAFSPDGTKISFVKNETKLMVADSDGSNIRELASADVGERWMLTAWSPKADKLAAAVYSSGESVCKLIEVSLTGAQKPITSPAWLRISGLAWLPNDGGIILTARDLDTTLSQIWHLSYPDGELTRVTNDLSSYQGLSVSSDGAVIASVQEDRNSNIWRVSKSTSETQLTKELGRDEGMSGIAAAPDGSVVYTTRVKGTQDISIVYPSGQTRQLTERTRSNFSPVVSPDGKYIVFVSTRAGNPNLWRMDITGENVVQLTKDPGIAGEPSITPDGKYVIFDQTDEQNRTTIWRIGLDGSGPQQLSTMEAARPTVSPDGNYIACLALKKAADGTNTIGIFPIGGGPANILDIAGVARSRMFRWSADGKALIYIGRGEHADNLWQQPVSGGEPTQLTNFTRSRMFRFALTQDGAYIVSRGEDTSDAVLISRGM